jgi:hypothetical protein
MLAAISSDFATDARSMEPLTHTIGLQITVPTATHTNVIQASVIHFMAPFTSHIAGALS